MTIIANTAYFSLIYSYQTLMLSFTVSNLPDSQVPVYCVPRTFETTVSAFERLNWLSVQRPFLRDFSKIA